MNYLVHIYSLLCALETTAFGKKRGDFFHLFSIFLYSSLFVLFFSILFLSLSCLVASCWLTRKLSGIERIQIQPLDIATVLGHQTFYHKSLKGEFGSRTVLATPGSGIFFQVDKPGKLVLANVLSRLMLALLPQKIVPVLWRDVGHLWQGSGVLRAGCWNQAAQGLVGSILVAPHQNSRGPRASSAFQSPFSASWTGQRISELLLLFSTASEHCCSWCMQTLQSFGTGLLFLSKGSRKKKFKTKNSSGCV